MKKLLLVALLFILSTSMFSQETFVRKYTSMITKKDDVFQPWETIDLTVVFNPNNLKEVVFYYISGKTMTFYQVNSVVEGKTINGDEYQAFDCVDQDGSYVTLQLFDDDTTLRVLIAKGYMVEFHND